MTLRPCKLLILMSDTGGGHRSAAEAIAEATANLYGAAWQMQIADVLVQHTPFPWNRAGRLYAPAVSGSARAWRLLWRLTDSPRRTRWLFTALYPWLAPGLRRLFLAAQPDAVISVHPAFNHLGVWTLRRMSQRTPFITVVTDLVRVHPLWLCPQVNLCLTATEQARQDALRAGLPAHKTRVVGLPVSARFHQTLPSKPQARASLGLHPDRPLILLMGGGEGVGRLYQIAAAIAEARPAAQMAAIAGRNEKLRCQLAAADWSVPTHVAGFVNNVPQWMAAADILVSKAGPGVLSEAFIMGLPLVLYGAIPGQEAPNVDYVVTHGAGVAETDPARIAAWLVQCLQASDETLVLMSAAARRLARPQAALQIVQQIAALLPGRLQE